MNTDAFFDIGQWDFFMGAVHLIDNCISDAGIQMLALISVSWLFRPVNYLFATLTTA